MNFCLFLSFQYIEFYARHEGLFGSGNLQSRSVSRIVAEASRDQVQAGQNDKWENVALRIPPIPPSRLVGCNIINIAYVIKVMRHLVMISF